MVAHLRIVILFLLFTLSLQSGPESQQHLVERTNTASAEYEGLLGTFDDDLKNDLGNLAIGTKSFQDQIGKEREKVVSEGGYLQNNQIITELNKKLSQRLKDKISAVNNIVTEVINAVISGKTAAEDYHECCYLPDDYKLTYDPRFKDAITFEVFCQQRAPSHLQEEQLDLKEMKTAFDKNMKKSSLKVRWQYFGSAEGILTGYPAAKASDCDGYDNRLRPWYVATATPEPKNIMILLDCSTSMGADKSLEYAKESAKVVLGTLNPLDKVSVILFNASTYLPGDQTTHKCYSSTMAFAGLLNIKNFKSFVDTAKPKGGTRYIKAFKKAFEILKHTFSTSSQDIVSRPSMILLLTDDGPEKNGLKELVIGAVKEEFQTFRTEFSKTSLKLLVLNFGKDKTFFDQLANGTDGISMSAQGKSDTQSRLKPYFDYLMKVTPPVKSKVVFSPPYVDAFGAGFMVTAACAVIDDKNKFRGVVGVDILMTDLVSDVQYFRRGSLKSYAFMFHAETGVTLSHPKLPSPETITEDPDAVNILELEHGEEFRELFYEVQKTALAKKLERSTKFIKDRQHSIAVGGTLGDGVKVEQVNYRYTCQPLDTTGREYITCIAIKERDADDRFATSQILANAGSHPITYHRMDVLPEATTCYHTDTLSYADRSVIKLSANAFVDPAGYFEEEENPRAIRRYMKQLHDETHNFQMHKDKTAAIRRNVPTTAAVTSYLDRIVWGSGSTKFKQYSKRFVRRFVATYTGVLRMFPGAPLSTNFDHVTRPWFISAVANDGNITLTHPYLDPLGAGFIVSVSHTVRMDAAVGNDHKTYAVVGGDLTISSLGASLVEKMGEKCRHHDKLQCFLMDTSGYIIYHPNFENAYNVSDKVVGKHITEMDGAIAQDLIKNGLMKRRACKNFNILKIQRFYEVDVKTETFKGKESSRNGVCDAYTIARIPDTNVFVVRVKSATCLISAAKCPCQDICTSNEKETCECPCKSRLDYDVCNANLTGGHDIPVCAQPSPPVVPRNPLPEHPDDLGECIKTNCGKHNTRLDCNEKFGCVWCQKDAVDGSLLNHPRCRKYRECYGGEQGKPNPFLLPFKPRKPNKYVKLFRLLGLEFTLKTLITIGTSVVVGLSALIIFIGCLCKRRNKWELDVHEMFGESDVNMMDMDMVEMDMMNYPGQQQSTMHMGQRQSTMRMGQRPSTMQMGHRQSAMHMGQRPSTMQMGHRQSAMHMGQRPSTMQMGHRQSAMHMGQRPSSMQMGHRQFAMHMGQRPSAMQMGHRQSAMHMGQRQSTIQMQLNAPGAQYSMQAMSGMWSQPFDQSQVMNYVPQENTMQTPGAIAGMNFTPNQKKVSFSTNIPDDANDF